jgi:hypothetical protein
MERYGVFHELLKDGERVCGEWLAQAHGTRYALAHDPFVAFDIIDGTERLPFDMFYQRAKHAGLTTPMVLSYGPPFSIEAAIASLTTGRNGHHGALDPVEGAVWRVERQGKVDFLGKYVRPDKQDGNYLPDMSGQPAVWNWRPEKH